jgi:hypothetical protein
MSGAVALPQIVTASPPALAAVLPSPVLLATTPNAPSVPPAVSAAALPNVNSSPAVPSAVTPTVSASKHSPPSPDVSYSLPNAAPHGTTTSSRTPHTTGTVSPSPSPSPSSSSSSSSPTLLLIGIAAAGLVAIVFLSIFIYCCLKKKTKKNRKDGDIGGKQLPSVVALEAGPDPCTPPPNPHSDHNVASAAGSSAAGKIPIFLMSSQTAGDSRSGFNYDELYTATDGFAPLNVLGEGGSGHVYKGKLPSGQAVTVKQLTITGTQGDIQS